MWYIIIIVLSFILYLFCNKEFRNFLSETCNKKESKIEPEHPKILNINPIQIKIESNAK